MELKFSFFSLMASSIIIGFFFLLISIVNHQLKVLISNNKPPHQKLPPGPWKLPFIGNILHLAGSLPHRGLRDLANKHGPLMHLQLGEISAIVISSPRMAKEVLKTHDLAFADRPQLLASKIVLYNNTDMGFSPYGAYWRQMRKICALELLSPTKVLSFRSVREDEVRCVIESIRSSSPMIINLTKQIFSLVNSLVCRAAIGTRCKDQESLIKMIQELISSAGGFDVADLFPSFKMLHVLSGTRPKLERLHHKVDHLLGNIISERVMNKKCSNKSIDADQYQEEEEDLLDVLLRLKESRGLQVPITSNNVKAIILDMFSGATDTSSATIEWAMSEMIRDPRVMKKAQAEIREALKGKKIIGEADIQELSYLKMVIKETLRLHPPAPLLLPRECREECEIEGYIIPVKTKVIVNAWAIGRDPEYWGDDAESFRPERFIDSSVDYVGTNLEYIPFGAGRRMCPGVLFGLADVELPLAQFLYHFNWKLPAGGTDDDHMKPQDLDMTEIFGAGVKKRNNLYLIATPYVW